MENTDIKILHKQIQNTINERGFYLYEWISTDEFRKSIQLDYFTILGKFWKPIAIFSLIVTAIVAFVFVIISKQHSTDAALMAAIIKSLPFTIASIIVWFLWVTLVLFGKTLRKGNIYRKIANLTVVDGHVVTHEQIIPFEKFQKNQKIQEVAELFHEKPFANSELTQTIDTQKNITNNNIDGFWKKSFDTIPTDSKNWAFFLLVLVIIRGFFFAIMKWINFLFLPVIAFFAWSFANISHKFLLFSHRTEYSIQNLFEKLDKSTENIQDEKTNIILSLQDAKNNNWTENLSGKINQIFEKINSSTELAISQNQELKKILENSRYKDIFNFGTFHNWTKKQILEPLESLTQLLEINEKNLKITLESLQNQIQNTQDASLQKPLILQQKRLEIQIVEFQKMQTILKNYQNKLL